MRLLLDTHVAIWAISDSPKLSRNARDLIDDPANEIFVSTATLWEIAIKHARKRGDKDDMPFSGAEALRYFNKAGYQILEITPVHAIKVEELPALHADPFDRILVAQCLTEPLRLLTRDKRVVRYSDSIIAV